MLNHYDFDTTPSEETCAKVGQDGYEGAARREGHIFIHQLERVHGPAPVGSRYYVASNPHDFGTYYTVRFEYNDENQEAIEYFSKVESDLPQEWDEEAKAEAVRLEERKNIQAEERRHANAMTEGDIAEAMFDSVCEAADGCQVEPDGRCEHGYRSPLLVLGMI